MKSGREGVMRSGIIRSVRGFTLIELLLVIIIIAIATGMAIPSFVRSYQGSKLRTSVRTIVMASRYARSVAVLQQMQAAILYDMEAQTVEVVAIKVDASADDRNVFLDNKQEQGMQSADDLEAQAEARRKSAAVIPKLRKAMAEGVKIISVSSEEGGRELEGIYWVNYYPNGMCDDYVIRLRDAYDKTVEIEIDPISAKAVVEYGR